MLMLCLQAIALSETQYAMRSHAIAYAASGFAASTSCPVPRRLVRVTSCAWNLQQDVAEVTAGLTFGARALTLLEPKLTLRFWVYRKKPKQQLEPFLDFTETNGFVQRSGGLATAVTGTAGVLSARRHRRTTFLETQAPDEAAEMQTLQVVVDNTLAPEDLLKAGVKLRLAGFPGKTRMGRASIFASEIQVVGLLPHLVQPSLLHSLLSHCSTGLVSSAELHQWLQVGHCQVLTIKGCTH